MDRTKRNLRVMLVACLALVILGGLAACVLHFRGERAWKARTAELRARGEKLSVAELEPLHPRAESNACLALLALTNQISELYSNLGTLPPSGRFAAAGRAVVASHIDSWSSESDDHQPQLPSKGDAPPRPY